MFEDEPKKLLLKKCLKAGWGRTESAIKKYLKILPDGSIQFSSVDDLAKITLFPNGFLFQVDYQQYLPKKKPLWVNRAMLGEDTENFTKDFLNSVGTSAKSMKKEMNVMRMGYEYVKVQKIFNIWDFPVQWSYPLYIVLAKYEEVLSQRGKTINISARFSLDFGRWVNENLQELSHFPNFNNFSEQPDPVFQTPKRDTEYLLKQNLTELTDTSADVVYTELSKDIKALDETDEIPIGKDSWKDDNKSPLADLYRNDSPVYYQYTKDFVIWLSSNGQAVIYSSRDQSIFLLNNEGTFFSQYLTNERSVLAKEEDEYEMKFHKDTIPPRIRNSKCPEGYEIHEPVNEALRMKAKAKIVTLNEPQNQHKSRTYDINFDPRAANFELLQKVTNPIGCFEAYKNRTVKVLFSDRTILRIDYGDEHASIISKTGESLKVLIDKPNDYAYYINHALDFYEDMFLDSTTKVQKIQQLQEITNIIQTGLERNERVLHLTGYTESVKTEQQPSFYLQDSGRLNESELGSFYHSPTDMSRHTHQFDMSRHTHQFDMSRHTHQMVYDIDEISFQIQA